MRLAFIHFDCSRGTAKLPGVCELERGAVSGRVACCACRRCGRPVWLSVAAVAATICACATEEAALEVHGMVFLLAAAGISGLLNEVFDALAGTTAGRAGMECLRGLGLRGCLLCGDQALPRKSRGRDSFIDCVCGTGDCGAGGFAGGRAGGADGAQGDSGRASPCVHSHFDGVRGGDCAGLQRCALAANGVDAHWLCCVALLAVKLVLEDLRHGHLGFIAGSIFLFAITLIVVPRVARMGQKV